MMAATARPSQNAQPEAATALQPLPIGEPGKKQTGDFA